MKKILLVILILFAFNSMDAQTIPNAGFEDTLVGGQLSNWGNVYLTSITIDSLGNTITDSIVFDGGGYYYGKSPDAHSGNSALILRNAYNYTANYGIVGAVGLSVDSEFSGWGILTTIPLQYVPDRFSFYYKFEKASANDSAGARLRFYDSAMNEVGNGDIIISNATSVYQYVQTTISYTDITDVAYYSLSFTNSYSYADYPSVVLGTRLTIDDITFDGITPVNELRQGSLVIFPNPSSENFQLINSSDYQYTATILSLTGMIVGNQIIRQGRQLLETEHLSPGVYIVDLKNECEHLIKKLIKN